MIPLFGESDGDGKRAVLEGRLIALALQAVRIGSNVILDFGCWGRHERSSLRSVFEVAGAEVMIVYLAVDRQTQLERIERRRAESPETTLAMSEDEVDQWRAQFEEPSAEELDGSWRPAPPAPWPTWASWMQERWPGLGHGEAAASRRRVAWPRRPRRWPPPGRSSRGGDAAQRGDRDPD